MRLSPDGNALAVVRSNSCDPEFFFRQHKFNGSFLETRGSDFCGDFGNSYSGDGHLSLDIPDRYPFTLAIGGIDEDGSISLFRD